MNNKYLFILCPPASGSTILWNLIKTSPNVSYFKTEGKSVLGVKDILGTKERWNPELFINWNIVKNEWHKEWNLSKKILLEKSPPNLIRAFDVQSNFDKSYFIVMIRNPYAYCEGAKRRRNRSVPFQVIVRRWVYFAKFQIKNIEYLNSNKIFFKYEDLTGNIDAIKEKILHFLPDLKTLNFNNEFRVFDRKLRITNLNERQISRLSKMDIAEINGVLRKYPDVMEYFGYTYIHVRDKLLYRIKSKYFNNKYVNAHYYKKDDRHLDKILFRYI